MRRNNTLLASAAVAAVTALLGACSESSADSDDKADERPSTSPATPSEESSTATQGSNQSSSPTEEIVLPDGVVELPAPDPGDDVATLDAGRYRIPLGDTLAFDVDVARDTYAHDDGIFLASGSVVLKTEVAGQAYGVPRDPCTDHAIEPVGPTTADLVEAIGNQPIYQVSRPEPVELGGAEGTYLEIRIPSDYDSSQCGDGVVLPSNPDTAVAFEPGYRSRWWILDVDGERIAVQQNCVCSADDFDRAAAMPRSITFPPTT